MRATVALGFGAVLLGGAFFLAVAPPASAAPCDAYSRTCPSTPPHVIGGGTSGATQSGTGADSGAVTGNSTGRTLPFTGAELTLLTLVGGTALAGGTALVVAGWRRHSA